VKDRILKPGEGVPKVHQFPSDGAIGGIGVPEPKHGVILGNLLAKGVQTVVFGQEPINEGVHFLLIVLKGPLHPSSSTIERNYGVNKLLQVILSPVQILESVE